MEWEFALVDHQTRDLSNEAAAVIADIGETPHVHKELLRNTVEVVTGSLEERRFAAIYGRGGRIVAVLGMNRPRHVMQYRQLIAQRASFDDALAFAAEQRAS